MAVTPGQIYLHRSYYFDQQTQKHKPKYLLILAAPAKSDLIYRLLTSKQNGRPFEPCCYHGNPLPGYYLGKQLCDRLQDHSWLDLRRASDFDTHDFAAAVKSGKVELVTTLHHEILRPALQCAAAADDTSVIQEQHILNCMSALPA